MGNPVVAAAPAPKYRDDPDAVSMHTTRSDYEYDDTLSIPDTLPSYDDSEEAAATSSTVRPDADARRASRVTDVPDIYSVIQPGGSNGVRVLSGNKPKNCNEITYRMDQRLNNPEELLKYINGYLRMMRPKQTVRIYGYHQETVRKKDKKEKEHITDFDITLSLQGYLSQVNDEGFWVPQTVENTTSTYRGGWPKTRAKGYTQDIQVSDDPQPDLQEWCHRFCEDKSKLKIFRVNRTVTGFDTETIRRPLNDMIKRLHYRGHIDISFPIEERAVDIYTEYWINKARISWVRWIFYLTFLWIFTWPVLYFITKRWEVYIVEWRFSYYKHEQHGSPKKYATISEVDWYSKHENLIRNLVLERHQGDATGHATNVRPNPNRRMPSSGNANVDSAVNFIQDGVNVWNSMSNGRGVDTDGWGYDC